MKLKAYHNHPWAYCLDVVCLATPKNLNADIRKAREAANHAICICDMDYKNVSLWYGVVPKKYCSAHFKFGEHFTLSGASPEDLKAMKIFKNYLKDHPNIDRKQNYELTYCNNTYP